VEAIKAMKKRLRRHHGHEPLSQREFKSNIAKWVKYLRSLSAVRHNELEIFANNFTFSFVGYPGLSSIS
jgi:hypothetical protein